MSMWGNTTDSISSLPYHDAILSMFSASSLDAKFQIIRKNLAALTSHATLDALEEDIERSWEQGDRTMADFLWQMQQLLRRVRSQGVEATIAVYTQPIERMRDINILLERSATPFQTLKGISTLLAALNTRDEYAVYRVLSEYVDQFRQPISAVFVRHTGQIPMVSLDVGTATLEHAAQLLDAIAHGQDIEDIISTWRPSKEQTLQELSEPRRTIAEFLTTENWHEAQRCAQNNYDILLSNSALDVLRSATRDAWQSNRNLGRQMWRHLRLLEHARKHGIDVAFGKLIWDPNAEQFWQSSREIGIMEAANVPLGDLRGLDTLLTALNSGDERILEEWIGRHWDDIQHPWMANYIRYMAEISELDSNSSTELWEGLADWLDEMRRADSQNPTTQKRWLDLPNVDGLTIL